MLRHGVRSSKSIFTVAQASRSQDESPLERGQGIAGGSSPSHAEVVVSLGGCGASGGGIGEFGGGMWALTGIIGEAVHDECF